jgi:hypothetical protein
MSSILKRAYLRTALSPSLAPKSKTITPEREAELNRRTAEWNAKPPKLGAAK